MNSLMLSPMPSNHDSIYSFSSPKNRILTKQQSPEQQKLGIFFVDHPQTPKKINFAKTQPAFFFKPNIIHVL